VDDLLKTISGAAQGQPGATGAGGAAGIGGLGGGLDDVLGGLLGSGGLGNILGAGAAGSAASGTGGGAGSIMGGGLGALISTLLPAILGLLGGQGANGQTGLHQLVDAMHANGLGDVAQSWVSGTDGQPITPAQVEQVLSSGQLADLSAKSGIPADQVSAGVASVLPHIVASLTPNGTLPDATQVQGAVGQLQQMLAGLTGGQ
jgi:uncharacterized protein YidB (DUF937 family)